MSDDWDDYAEDWDADESVHLFAAKAFDALNQHVDFDDTAWQTRRVLDFGCGTGILTEKLAPLVGHVMAVDTSAGMIAVLQGKALANVTAVCGDLGDAKTRQAADWFSGFDLTVASSVMSFVPDYDTMAAHLVSALVPGGRFVQWDWQASDGAFGLTAAQIDKALTRAGLTDVRVAPAFEMQTKDGPLGVLMGMGTA